MRNPFPKTGKGNEKEEKQERFQLAKLLDFGW